MEFRFDVERKYLIIICLIAGLIIIAGAGYGYVNPTTGVGHDYNEIETCGINQVLKMNPAGAWACSKSFSYLTSSYSSGFGGSRSMIDTTEGICFLTGFSSLGGSPDCEITVNSGRWEVVAGNPDTQCKARCVSYN